jgi:integrase/recombinase XerD
MKTARAIPNVQVYARHRPDCRLVRFHKKIGCDCPKQLTWFRDGKLHRLSADTCDSEVAERKAREMTVGFEAAAKGEPVPTPVGARMTLLDDAVKVFIDTKAASGVTEKHVAKLRFEMEAYARFSLARGQVNLGDIRTEDCLAYQRSLVGAQNTKAKKIFRLIGFFRFCVEMNWITRNPAQTQTVKLKYDDTQTPKALTDAQFTTVLAAVQQVNGRTSDDQRRKLHALLLLMRWTGLAIRDAVTIERARFEANGNGFTKLFLRRAKTGHAVSTTIRTDVMTAILAGANPDGRWLFVNALPTAERDMDNLIKNWGVLFAKLGDVAGLTDEHGAPYHFTSHSMRHTFVFWALNAGLPTEDVAALLGDSVEIVAKHYSGWIAGRQARLTERMETALSK